jgi:hypothetical protein
MLRTLLQHSDVGTINSLPHSQGSPVPERTESYPSVLYHKGGTAVATLHPKVMKKKDPPTERDRKVEKLLKAVADGDINMVGLASGFYFYK